MLYKSPPVGKSIRSRMYGIRDDIIYNNREIRNALYESLKEDNFTILNAESALHEFEGQGCTVYFVLAESHASVHTFPEYRSLRFELYTCRGPEDGMKSYRMFRDRINPEYEEFEESLEPVDPDFLKKGKESLLPEYPEPVRGKCLKYSLSE